MQHQPAGAGAVTAGRVNLCVDNDIVMRFQRQGVIAPRQARIDRDIAGLSP